ncbi:MAG: hypothetical protein ACXVB9_17650 [Bdellovibrionota bacterium]
MKIILLLSLLFVSSQSFAGSFPGLFPSMRANFSGGCSVDADCAGVDSFCSGATQDYPGICECTPYGVQPISIECGPDYQASAPVPTPVPAPVTPVPSSSCNYDTDCPNGMFCSGVTQDYPGFCR